MGKNLKYIILHFSTIGFERLKKNARFENKYFSRMYSKDTLVEQIESKYTQAKNIIG